MPHVPAVRPTAGRRVGAMFDADQLGLRERETLRGIARYAEAAGWQLVIDPFALYHTATRWDGILVRTRKGLARPLARCTVPVVCVAWSQWRPSLTHAVENRYAAGRLAARHLVERGYGTFGYLGFTRDIQSRVERTEFSGELRRLGRRMASARTFVTFAAKRQWWDKVAASLSHWLDRLGPPVGIFVARPGLARALADLALARGLRIPHDVGIVAADNDPVVCELPPALTSIHFDYAEVGRRAAALLDHLIDGAPPPKHAVLVQPTLVPRQSTDRQAVADPLVANALWLIDSRRSEPIRPRDVAAALGVGARILQRRFRRAGRDTVEQEILKARVEHAKLLLTDPRSTMAAVARESGFGSYEALFRAFKRHAGVPPSQWRRQARLHRRGAKDAETMPERRGRGPRGRRRKHDSRLPDT